MEQTVTSIKDAGPSSSSSSTSPEEKNSKPDICKLKMANAIGHHVYLFVEFGVSIVNVTL